uniref:Uncharacterized protein n=1 Tax=Anguilla anguilla TaxID=7936 RepID=A0A0E9PPU7_ANGAN
MVRSFSSLPHLFSTCLLP